MDDRISSNSVKFGGTWSDLVGFGRIWSDLVGFGGTWLDLVGFGRILIFGKFCQLGRNQSDSVRIGWTQFGRIWSGGFGWVGFGRILIIGRFGWIWSDFDFW